MNQVRDEGNCGEVTTRGEEACEDARNRRVCRFATRTSSRQSCEDETKSKVVPWQELEFLGFCVRGRSFRIRLSAKSLQKFKRRVKELTSRSWGVSMERRLSELRRCLRGWAGYFCLAMELKLFDRLDQWIRRRIRMCFWKRWRHGRTRSRELMRL